MTTTEAPAPPDVRLPATTARTRHTLGRVLATLARSVAIFVPVFLVATFVTFALRSLSGLSPARIQLGEEATPEAVARVEAHWGLNRPFLVQYADWFGDVLHGQLGASWTNGADISTLIGLGLGVSLSVATFALLIGVVAGFALGTVAALRRTTWVDRAITGFVTVISVMPAFVVGIVLVAVFAVGLHLFPSAGYVPAEQGFGPWLAHITLPAVALSFDVVADVARQLRGSLIGAYRENYVTGAVVRGLSPRRIFFGHVLRNGLGPALATLGLKFPALVGASVVTEWIFGLQGFGRFANDSAQAGDVPAVQGVLVVSIVLVVAFNLLVNLVLARVTPAAQRGVTMVRRVLSLATGRIALAVLAVIAVLALFGPLLAPQNPLATGDHPLAAASGAHWLGTDYLGRDVLSRLLDGSRVSVLGSLEVAFTALAIGAVPGILSVHLGRVFEWVTLRLADTLVALPFLLFAVAVIALLGNGLSQAMLVTGALVSPLFYRVARAATLAVARSPYVEAAIVSGASIGWVVRRHVWAKVLPPIAVALAQTVGVGFVIVSSLTFLGIGVQPPAPTWGGLLASDLGYLSHQPWAPLAPALLIMVTVWACNLLADAIRDVSGEAGRALVNTRKARANRRREADPAPAGGVR